MEDGSSKWWICLYCGKRHFGEADHFTDLIYNQKKPLWKWCPKCHSSSKPEEENHKKEVK